MSHWAEKWLATDLKIFNLLFLIYAACDIVTGLRNTMNIYTTGILFNRGQWCIDFHFGEDRSSFLEGGTYYLDENRFKIIKPFDGFTHSLAYLIHNRTFDL